MNENENLGGKLCIGMENDLKIYMWMNVLFIVKVRMTHWKFNLGHTYK